MSLVGNLIGQQSQHVIGPSFVSKTVKCDWCAFRHLYHSADIPQLT